MRKVCFLVAILMSSVASPAAESISGVVESTKGVESGVWVIAETTDLPTKFVKAVGSYGIIPSPVDASVWIASIGFPDASFGSTAARIRRRRASR